MIAADYKAVFRSYQFRSKFCLTLVSTLVGIFISSILGDQIRSATTLIFCLTFIKILSGVVQHSPTVWYTIWFFFFCSLAALMTTGNAGPRVTLVFWLVLTPLIAYYAGSLEVLGRLKDTHGGKSWTQS